MPAPKPSPLPVETISAPSIAPAPTAEVTRKLSDVDRTRQYFAKAPRERIRVPKSEGRQFVQINGYSFVIEAGEFVEVPVDVADLLREAGII